MPINIQLNRTKRKQTKYCWIFENECFGNQIEKKEFDAIWKYNDDDDDIYFSHVHFDLTYEKIIDEF